MGARISSPKPTGTASIDDVAAGKTFSSNILINSSGNAPDKRGSATVITPSGIDQAIPAGLYDGITGSGKVASLKVTPGETLQFTNPSNPWIPNSTHTKLLETRIDGMSGIIRVKFSLTGNAGVDTNAQIYVNGVTRGTIRSKPAGDSSTTNYSEDITFNAGDLIQIYGWNNNTGNYGAISLFKLYTNLLLPTFVNTL